MDSVTKQDFRQIPNQITSRDRSTNVSIMFHFALKRWLKAGREVLWGLFFDWLLITAAVLGEEFQSRLTTGWIFITVHRGSSRPIQSRFQKQRWIFVSLCSIFSVLCTKAVSNIVIYHHLCIFWFTLFPTKKWQVLHFTFDWGPFQCNCLASTTPKCKLY